MTEYSDAMRHTVDNQYVLEAEMILDYWFPMFHRKKINTVANILRQGRDLAILEYIEKQYNLTTEDKL